MKRAFWASIVVHGGILIVLWVALPEQRSSQETFSLQIRMDLSTSRLTTRQSSIGRDSSWTSHRRSLPNERLIPQAKVAVSHDFREGELELTSQDVVTTSTVPRIATWSSPPPRRRGSARALLNPDSVLDPFAGIALPEKDHNLPENSSPWSLTWASGEKRAILSFPMMDLSHLPEQLVDLNDMEFLIHVAPSGQVLSADATAPGSGDVRVDRYAAALALEIIFEARPDDFGVQQGRLRVFFQEDAP